MLSDQNMDIGYIWKFFESTFEKNKREKSQKCTPCDFICPDPSSLKVQFSIHTGENHMSANCVIKEKKEKK